MLALAVVVTCGWPFGQSSTAQPQHESPFFQKLKKYEQLMDLANNAMEDAQEERAQGKGQLTGATDTVRRR